MSNVNRTAPPPVIIHDPVDTSKTRSNIVLYCVKFHIPQELLWSEEIVWNQDRSRVGALDRNGLVRRHIEEHPEEWAHGSGRNHNKYGIKFQHSWRYNSQPGWPSMQVLEYNATGGEYDKVYEIDIDEASLKRDPVGHWKEVLRHEFAFTEEGRRTDPDVIEARLLSIPDHPTVPRTEERADA